jgi:hypothetical protein
LDSCAGLAAEILDQPRLGQAALADQLLKVASWMRADSVFSYGERSDRSCGTTSRPSSPAPAAHRSTPPARPSAPCLGALREAMDVGELSREEGELGHQAGSSTRAWL